jgi:hypothetical protein
MCLQDSAEARALYASRRARCPQGRSANQSLSIIESVSDRPNGNWNWRAETSVAKPPIQALNSKNLPTRDWGALT